MMDLIRSLFGHALKTNEHLFFAVLTGCLRVAKESIFTGLNNFKVMPITNCRFDEHFGFTDTEVKDMLEYYGLGSSHALIKEWYDGYCFGKTDVYCPWDVLNYTDLLLKDPNARPRAFWINSSSNTILRTLLEKATPRTRQELGCLISGTPVTKKINEELTYRELYDSLDNIWSTLFTTGYLTKQKETDLNTYELVIPNQEIRMIFTEQILNWFQEEARKDPPALNAFCEAFRQGAPLSSRTTVLFLPEKDHQHPGYRCAQKQKRKLLPRHSSWPFKPSGGLAPFLQHGIRTGLQRYPHRASGRRSRHCNRTEIF